MTEHLQTRDWTATDTAFTLDKRFNEIVVHGEIQTLKTSEHPELVEAQPQGINPKILLLDLKVPASGIGGDIVQWRPISFKKEIDGAGFAYDEVEIKGAVAQGVKIKVHQITA